MRVQKNLSRHVLRLEEYEHGERAPPNSWVLLERTASAEDAPWSTINLLPQAGDGGEEEGGEEDVVDCMEYDDAESDPVSVQIDAVD